MVAKARYTLNTETWVIARQCVNGELISFFSFALVVLAGFSWIMYEVITTVWGIPAYSPAQLALAGAFLLVILVVLYLLRPARAKYLEKDARSAHENARFWPSPETPYAVECDENQFILAGKPHAWKNITQIKLHTVVRLYSLKEWGTRNFGAHRSVGEKWYCIEVEGQRMWVWKSSDMSNPHKHTLFSFPRNLRRILRYVGKEQLLADSGIDVITAEIDDPKVQAKLRQPFPQE